MFAYEQCLLVLGHHPDIWYEAAQYLEQSSKLLAEKGVGGRRPLFKLHQPPSFLFFFSPSNASISDVSTQDMNNSKLFSDEAANIYERAIGTLLKKNMLLYFSFGDYEEVIVHLSESFSIYRRTETSQPRF